jgi:hypothetical protein
MRTYLWTALLLFGAAQCGGTVNTEEASGGGAGASGGGGDAGSGGCKSFCEGLCSPHECGNGEGVPTCPEGVPCEKVSLCSVAFCAYCSSSGCDPGDTEAASGQCPAGEACYEQLLCDATTIFCVDAALPPHGCPHSKPDWGPAACWPFYGLSCSYEDASGCVETYECAPDGAKSWLLTSPPCG